MAKQVKLKRGLYADCMRMSFFLFPLIFVLISDMGRRYWSLNDEILPFSQLEKTSGYLYVTKRSRGSRGFRGTQIGVRSEHGKTCCFRVVTSWIPESKEGRKVDVYWQRSANLLARLNDQKYVLHMDVYKDDGTLDYPGVRYKSSLERYKEAYLEEEYPALGWYGFAVLVIVMGYFMHRAFKRRHGLM
ncbi:hypothetical protein [Aliamphritea hakodatensis]|uniref:hypothetical protein n=1 Tax=Aliamphritea hakodatensis TaxID=2895352 RepID=UPI0022FD7201|nr:hypothetical protein [Aliamphritea hakodatensis]